jgi:hypothetical protein
MFCFFCLLFCFSTKIYGSMTPQGTQEYIKNLRRQPGFRDPPPPEWFLGGDKATGKAAEQLNSVGDRAKTFAFTPSGDGPKDPDPEG